MFPRGGGTHNTKDMCLPGRGTHQSIKKNALLTVSLH